MVEQAEPKSITIMDALGIKQVEPDRRRYLTWPESVFLLGVMGMFFGTICFMGWLLLA